MTDKNHIELIKKYAPILWFHQDEAFLPESCAVMEKYAQIGKSLAGMKPFKLDELGDLKDSDDYFMDIPTIDFTNFGMNSAYTGSKMGPEALSAFVRQEYGNNRFLNPEARPPAPLYFGRVSEIKIGFKRGEPFSEYYKTHDPGIFGEYDVIQYYFFSIFNDSWNKHLSDWDSTLELFLKKDKGRAYAIFHLHYLRWMVRFSSRPMKLRNWIDRWQKVEQSKQMGSLFHHALHPFVFVALGAHGGYPTPGFSIHGLKALKTRVIGQTDYRQIGKVCLFPDYSPVTEKALRRLLGEAGINPRKTKFLAWKEPIILDKQPWLRYKGLWGTKTEYSGWSGSTGPSRKKYWRMDQRRFKRAYSEAAEGDYSDGWVLKIFKNWHGWR